MDTERIMEIQRAANTSVSLEEPLYGEEEDRALGDLLPDTESDAVEDLATNNVFAEEVCVLLEEVLNPRELQVVQMRFSLGGKPPQKLEEVGRQLGITRERVRQIEAAALKKLKQSPQLRHLYQSL